MASETLSIWLCAIRATIQNPFQHCPLFQCSTSKHFIHFICYWPHPYFLLSHEYSLSSWEVYKGTRKSHFFGWVWFIQTVSCVERLVLATAASHSQNPQEQQLSMGFFSFVILTFAVSTTHWNVEWSVVKAHFSPKPNLPTVPRSQT